MIAEEYSLNYDTFMANLSQLKIIKAFSDIDVVKRGCQSIIQSSSNPPSTVVPFSLTPSSKSRKDSSLISKEQETNALMKS